MSAALGDIAHQIELLRRAVESPDWLGLIATALSTLAAAAIAALVSTLVLRRESRERYRARISGSLRALIDEMSEYSHDTSQAPSRPAPTFESAPVSVIMRSIRIQGAFQMLLAETNEKDSAVFESAQMAFQRAADLPRLGYRSVGVGSVAGTLLNWWRKGLSSDEAKELFAQLPGLAINEEVIRTFETDIPTEWYPGEEPKARVRLPSWRAGVRRVRR